MFLLLSWALAATPEATATYTRERLFRSAYAIVDGSITLTTTYDPKFAPNPWAVFDGEGHLLTADEFAADVGDDGMAARLLKADKKVKTGNIVATVAAIAAMSAGTTLGASGAPETTASVDPPDPRSALWQQLDKDRPVFKYYTEKVTDQLIVSHNAGLRRALGLTAEEVAAIEAPPAIEHPAP